MKCKNCGKTIALCVGPDPYPSGWFHVRKVGDSGWQYPCDSQARNYDPPNYAYYTGSVAEPDEALEVRLIIDQYEETESRGL